MAKTDLLTRIRRAARSGRAALRRFAEPSAASAVRLCSDAELIGALRDDLPALAGVREAVRSGDAAHARDLLAAHFRERAAPRFFLDQAEVAPLAARLAAERPDRRAQAMRAAGDWQRYVYSDGDAARRAPDLPDWNRLPLGPGRDTVAQHKAHHLLAAVQLARARAYGAQAVPVLRQLVESWTRATDGVPGAAGYSSPLIAVHRSVALTWTLAFLAGAGDSDPALELGLFRILLADARFVHARLGTSAPNNHLLADGFLMFYLGILYPEFREAGQWRLDGEALFWRELRRQVFEDGTSFEHSVHYHELVCEMLTAIVLLAGRNGIALEPWVEARLEAMLRFQAALAGPEAKSFAIGDCVETHLFPLDEFDGVGAAAHREILRALFDGRVAESRANAPGRERAEWLLGGKLAGPGASGVDDAPIAFPDGGFAVLPDADLDGCLAFRTGPVPGRLSNPGHMHADLLSVYLRLRGHPIIVDAGTFTYRSARERWPEGEPAWRAHFLGAAAHNALYIEGRDPLDRGPGDFPSGGLKAAVEMRPLATGGGLSWAEATVESETPYGGHVRGVVHVRGHYWVAYDLLPAAAIAERAWLSLHFAPDATAGRHDARAILARAGDARLLVALSAAHGDLQLVEGSREPLAGWVSPRYGERSPAPVCRMQTTGGPMIAATLIKPAPTDAAVPTVEVTQTGAAVGIRIICGNRVDCLVLPRGAPTSLFDLDFAGTALWLRTEDGRPTELRAIALSRLESSVHGIVARGRRESRDVRLKFGADGGLERDGEIDVVLK
ncbi:MAG: heparinase II/III family protein [Burkholderiales bacterium]|nr:heparinase II/III family protein [Burkholderiales bacterium]